MAHGGLFEFLNTSKRSVVGDERRPRAQPPTSSSSTGPRTSRRSARRTRRSWSSPSRRSGSTDRGSAGPPPSSPCRRGAGRPGGRGYPTARRARRRRRPAGRVDHRAPTPPSPRWRRSARPGATGRGEHVDVAMLDCMAVTMVDLPVGVRRLLRAGPTPRDRPHRRGAVDRAHRRRVRRSFTTNSAQQFEDFLVLIGRADLLEDTASCAARPTSGSSGATSSEAAVHEYTTARTTDEILDEAALLRIPAGRCSTARRCRSSTQFVERGVLRADRRRAASCQPRVPYRIARRRAPAVRARAADSARDTGTIDWDAEAPRQRPTATRRRCRSTGCASSTARRGGRGRRRRTCSAASAPTSSRSSRSSRPDLMRYAAHAPADRGPVVGVGTDVPRGERRTSAASPSTSPDPRASSCSSSSLRTADVLVENYTPRVMEQFGLGVGARPRASTPTLVMVRMPAFGLDGPWRDRTGFAQTMESITGMAWLTGFPTARRCSCAARATRSPACTRSLATLLAARRARPNRRGAGSSSR